MVKKSIIEQELTKEQMEWVKKNPEHDKVTNLLVKASMLRLHGGHQIVSAEGLRDASDEERISEFRTACKEFREWYEENKPK